LPDARRWESATEAPFSFAYDGQASAELFKDWPCQRTARKLDDQRTERTSLWTDPKSSVRLRCVCIDMPEGTGSGEFVLSQRQAASATEVLNHE